MFQSLTLLFSRATHSCIPSSHPITPPIWTCHRTGHPTAVMHQCVFCSHSRPIYSRNTFYGPAPSTVDVILHVVRGCTVDCRLHFHSVILKGGMFHTRQDAAPDLIPYNMASLMHQTAPFVYRPLRTSQRHAARFQT